MKNKTLPIGVCRTFYFSQSDRKDRLEAKKKHCFMAYYGGSKLRKFHCKRFPINNFSDGKEALRKAINWRRNHGPLKSRACDLIVAL